MADSPVAPRRQSIISRLGIAAFFAVASQAPGAIVVGTGDGTAAQVKVFSSSGVQTSAFLPYGAFTGGVRVGSADVTHDGFGDIITGAGPGAAGGHVKVFDGLSGAEVRSFLAFPGFTGGIFVAGGDVNKDGFGDILVGADAGGPAHVKVFDGQTGALTASFFAYAGFTGGVRVGAWDITGDGAADIITGAGPGAPGGHVKVFDGLSGVEIRSFFSYAAGFTGGAFVGGGDVDRDGFGDILTGADAGAAPHVKVFDGPTNAEDASFFAYGGFTGGVRVGAGDINGDGAADIITGAGPGASGGHVKVFDGLTGTEIRSFLAYPGFGGGVYVAGLTERIPEPGSSALVMVALGLCLRRRYSRGS
jgi:fibronectin-binding autotransporter adhesin